MVSRGCLMLGGNELLLQKKNRCFWWFGGKDKHQKNDGDSQGKALVLGFTMTSDGFGCVLTEDVSTTVSIAMGSLV